MQNKDQFQTEFIKHEMPMAKLPANVIYRSDCVHTLSKLALSKKMEVQLEDWDDKSS
jgi:hypothetical protein